MYISIFGKVFKLSTYLKHELATIQMFLVGVQLKSTNFFPKTG